MSAVAAASPRREFDFGPDDHRAISALAYSEAGIVLPPGKAQLVYGRIAPRVRATGLTRVADYIALIADDAEERARAIDALTTNHTGFWRECHHFEDFVERMWPALSMRLRKGGSVRLWSSACSSGEEPYSWLMAAYGSDRTAASQAMRGDLKLLATDLSPSVLQTARDGLYPPDILRPVPAALRSAWVKRQGDRVAIDPALRALVSFRQLNLLGDWPMRGTFDAIFCRNVMIYFDGPTKARLQTRLADRLVEGGMLYIGHSERLDESVAHRFRYVGRTAFLKVAP